MDASESQGGIIGAKGWGVGTRLAYGNAVGIRACDGGRFSLLLDMEEWYIAAVGIFWTSGAFIPSGDGLVEALFAAAPRSGYDSLRASAAADELPAFETLGILD
jgi:hypothetical protein